MRLMALALRAVPILVAALVPMRVPALLVASLPALVAACMPQQLVLRRASVDWESMGIRAVAVVPITPPRSARSGPGLDAARPGAEVSAAAAGNAAAAGPADADDRIRASGYSEDDLEPATRDAAELLTFALKQSAVEIAPPDEANASLARIELTVKDIRTEEEKLGEREVAAALRQSTLLSLRDDAGYLRTSRVVKATVLARLVEPGSSRPIWFKEAIGSVDMGLSRSSAASAGDPFPPPSRADRSGEEEVLRFYREIAVRRALKQIADDLLPHYEYVEVR